MPWYMYISVWQFGTEFGMSTAGGDLLNVVWNGGGLLALSCPARAAPRSAWKGVQRVRQTCSHVLYSDSLARSALHSLGRVQVHHGGCSCARANQLRQGLGRAGLAAGAVRAVPVLVSLPTLRPPLAALAVCRSRHC